MKPILTSLIALPLLACASSGTTTAVRPASGGTPLDRLYTAQESILEIVNQSKTPAEATERVSAYCAENEARMKDTLVELTKLAETDAEALGAESEKRGQALQTRYEKQLESKRDWLEDPDLIKAAQKCFGPPPAAEGDVEKLDGSPEPNEDSGN